MFVTLLEIMNNITTYNHEDLHYIARKHDIAFGRSKEVLATKYILASNTHSLYLFFSGYSDLP